MTKEEVFKLLVLIESVYSNCIFKDETVQQWFQFCSEMDYEKVLTKLKYHIRKSPYPPVISDIAVFQIKENHLPASLHEWMKEGQVRIEFDPKSKKRGTLPDWLAEYSPRKPV
jgi:hypothetical protein